MPASFMIRFMMIRPFLYRSCQKLFQCALTDTAIKDPSFHKVCMRPCGRLSIFQRLSKTTAAACGK